MLQRYVTTNTILTRSALQTKIVDKISSVLINEMINPNTCFFDLLIFTTDIAIKIKNNSLDKSDFIQGKYKTEKLLELALSEAEFLERRLPKNIQTTIIKIEILQEIFQCKNFLKGSIIYNAHTPTNSCFAAQAA